MFRKTSTEERSAPQGALNHRAYVVGDVHGRLDLLDDLLAQIDSDLRRRPARKVVLVFVGDLIDRGADSAGVIERLRSYRRPGIKTVFLLGNHEEVLLRILAGEAELIDHWLGFGGSECLASYGCDPLAVKAAAPIERLAMIRAAIPDAHLKFFTGCADSFRFGDYLIVHAGIRPGVPIDQQLQQDLRWIRAPFLQDPSDHGHVVVHGHTITDEVEERPNRIGIDTGAYATGRLTALVIEGDKRWFLATASQ